MLQHQAIGRLRANREVARDTIAARGQHSYGAARGSDEIADDANLHSFRPSLLLNDYFERMLDSFAAHGVGVEFIAVPMNQATFAKMDPSVVQAYESYLAGMAMRHANFKVDGPAIRPMDNRFFGDSTHLNLDGAALFSRQVNRIVNHGAEAAQRVHPNEPAYATGPTLAGLYN
jgi:hypothetical protein